MTTAHTPGPWIVGPHPGNSAGEDWRMILADTPEFGPLYIGEAIEPDARLIAAAPNMLSALMTARDGLQEILRTTVDNSTAENIDGWLMEIEAAIAKAGG